MFFLFFIYCSDNPEKFLEYQYSKNFYSSTLTKIIKNEKTIDSSSIFSFLQSFVIFYRTQFEKFFTENTLNKKSLTLFFNNKNNEKFINIFLDQDIENFPKIQKIFQAIMNMTSKEINFAFSLIEKYEKNLTNDTLKKKNKNYTKEYFSSYSVPENFKQNNEKIYMDLYKKTNFYTQKNKLNFFSCLNNFIKIFVEENLNKPTLNQQNKIYKLIFNYFLSKFHIDVINPFLYLINKKKSTLSTTSDIDLAEKNFQIFQKIYNEDNNLDQTSQLTYDSKKNSITNLSAQQNFTNKNSTDENISFIKYLFQQYPKTIYHKFIDILIIDNKINLFNLASLIIVHNFNACAKALDDLLGEIAQLQQDISQ